jgi:uncharacterized protein YbaP (TraB family)
VKRFSRCCRPGGTAAVLWLIAALAQIAPVHAQPPRNFLWKVSGKQSVIYLVGSIHLLTKDYYPLSPALDTAFKDSDLLVEETDLGELEAPASQIKLLTRGMLPANQSLEQVVSPSTYALVAKHVGDLGMPIEPLKRFKPWMLAVMLVESEWQKAGFDASLGLDRHFHDRATVEGKMVQGLETVDYQLALFDDMTMAQQDRMLAESLKDVDSEQANALKLTDAWRAGEVATVERIVLSDVGDDPEMYQRLLVNRNRNWMPRLDSFLSRAGHTFVVVGAAHLVGPDGLVTMLKAKGYKVDQL